MPIWTNKGGQRLSLYGIRCKPTVIAWVGIRTRGIQTDNPKRPCVLVGIRGDLLNESGSAAGGLVWKPNANFVSQRGGGVGEWHGVTYRVNDNGYKAILGGLVEATRKSLTRAQDHTTWQAKRS